MTTIENRPLELEVLDNPKSKPQTAKPSRRGLRRMLAFAAPYKFYLIGAFTAMVIGSLLGLTLPAMAGSLIDTVFVKADGSALNQIAIILIGVFALQAVFVFAQSFLLNYAGERVVADLRRKVYGHMQTLSLGFYNERRTGDLMSRLGNDVSQVQNAVTANLLSFVQSLITLAGGIVIIIVRDWRLVLLLLALIPVFVVIGGTLGRRVRKLSNQIATELGEASTLIEETISNQKTVKAFTREDYETGRYYNKVEIIFKIALRRIRTQSGFAAIMTFIGFSAITAVLWFGGHEVLQGHLSPGELVSTLIYMGVVAGPIGQLAGMYTEFQRALGAAERVFDLLDSPPTVTDATAAQPLAPVQGLLRFEEVDFSYDNITPVLRQLSFAAEPGKVLALVGPSGAGKTTIASLIPRFFDPTGGRITVDGQDIKLVQQKSLREQIGIVPQEPVLFGLTIRENIAYGRLEASFAEIEEAARAANAHEFIEKLPDGYDTLVGERGVKLSGGQRQRIAIARAILRDPRILILDEATSSLDNESESLVQEALDRLMRDRTTIVIAHRLSTIENADKIVVIEAGRLVEQGNHAELMAHEGLYYRLYTRSFED